MPNDTDRIEKTIVLRAPRARVWRALVDPGEFGQWFEVRLTGAFTPGARVQGAITTPGKYANLTFEMVIDPESPGEFIFTWCLLPLFGADVSAGGIDIR